MQESIILNADDAQSRAILTLVTALLPFTQDGSGAALRSLLDKLKESVSNGDFGAVGNGTTNDNTAVNAAVTRKNAVAKTYKVNTLLSKSYVHETGSYIDNGSTSNLAMSIANATINYKFSGRIESGDGQAVNDQSNGSSKVLFHGADIVGKSYGFLCDDAGTTDTQDVIVSHSFLYSDRADIVELNHYRGEAKNYLFTGLIMGTGVGSASAGAGFGFGVAGTKNWMLANTIVKFTRSEAIHIEDEQRCGQIGNVTVVETIDHGLYASTAAVSAGQGASDGINVANFIAKHNHLHTSHPTGSKTDFRGLYLPQTADGSQQAVNAVNIRMVGFDWGYDISGGSAREVCNLRNAVAIDCNVAINLTGGAVVRGEVLAVDCPTLIRASNTCALESIISDAQPTTIVDFVGNTTSHGFVLDHLQFPKNISHDGSGTDTINLMTLPTRMLARIKLRLNNNNHFFTYAANLKWDGTTLTVTDPLPRHIGNLSGATLIANSGMLALQLASSEVLIDKLLMIDLQGWMHITDDILVA